MNIFEVISRYRKAIYLIIAILVVAGIYSAYRLPSGIYPEVNFPRIVIVASAGDLPTGNMLLAVTRPIEEAISGVLGVYRIRSKTIRGESEISIQFLPRADMQTGLQQVQAKINEVRASFPPDTELTVERLTPAVFPVLSYNLTGEHISAADLRDYALYTIRPTLSRISGVGQVRVLGDTVREIEVVVDPQRLLASRLTLQQVEEGLRKANVIEALGRLNKDYKQFLLVISSGIPNSEAIGGIVVSGNQESSNGLIHLRDIAKVYEGSEDKLMLITGSGQAAAQINVSRQVNGNILRIEADAGKEIGLLKRILPPSLKIEKVYDLAAFIRESIRSVRDAIFIGLALSVIVLLFFLREWRSTLIAASTIPLTLIITLFAMSMLGQTLNLMSLGGMAVAIGLVIDDAIVVIENIHRHLEMASREGIDKRGAIRNATQEILGAVAGSTFTTVVVFLPLGLVEGVVGQFFAAFSITLSVAVLLSLVLAFTVIPLLAEKLLRSKEARSAEENLFDRITEQYDRGIRIALKQPARVLIVAVVLIAAGILLFVQLGSGFLPVMDEGSFVLDYWLPSGTSLAETDRNVRAVEEILRKTPEIQSFSRRTGAELGLFATEQSRGDILVRLKQNRNRDVEEIMNDVRVKVESSLPACRVEFVQILQDILGDLEGSAEPVEVKLFGEDLTKLQDTGREIGEKLQKVKGIVDLYNGVQQGNPEISVLVNPVEVERAGLDAESVAQQVSGALLGDVVTRVRHFDRLIGVRVRFPDEDRFNYAFIQQFPLFNEKTGAVVPLNAVASLQEENQQGELLRENQRQMLAVTARIEGTSLGQAIARVKGIMNQVTLPPGYTYEIGGQYQSQQHSFRQLLLVLFIAIMLVYILLVLQFREYLSALVILSAAPISLIGAFFMLWITGTEFNVSSFMGLIMLVGLIVKNGIILIEYTFQLCKEGMNLEEALAQAGKIRLRPILMTTLVTLFALLPLALGIGAGSELQMPLALSVIGGLSLSTFVTLIFVPVLLLRLKR